MGRANHAAGGPAPRAGPDDAPARLEVRGAVVRYGATRALDGVSASLRAGEVHCILGGNGAGKSTLLRVMSGAVVPAPGAVLMDGREVRWRSPRRAAADGVALVTQELQLLPWLSIAENVMLEQAPRVAGIILRRRMEAQALRCLQRVGAAGVDPRALLGEMPASIRQLVAVARGVAGQPRVLLLDEPTASLDVREAEGVLESAVRLSRQGVAVAFVTHFLEAAEQVADRISVLRDGRLVRTAPRAEWRRPELVDAIAAARAPADAAHPAANATGVAAPGPPLLELRGASRRGAVEDATLLLRAGAVTGLAGLLGSGRSELLRLLCGVDRLERGERRLRGVAVHWRGARDAVRAGVGLAPEDRRSDGIVDGLTVEENLLICLQVRRGWWRRITRREARRLVDGALAGLRVHGQAGQPAMHLSGGNQQKLLLGRLELAGLCVMALDEPTRGIDVHGKEDVRRLVRRLASGGVAVAVASVDLEEVAALSDHVVALRDRRTLGELTPPFTERRLLDAVAAPDPARGAPP